MTIKFKRDDTYMEMNVGITFMIASGYGNASNSLEVVMLCRLTLIVQPLEISYSVVCHVMLSVATNLYADYLILYSSSGTYWLRWIQSLHLVLNSLCVKFDDSLTWLSPALVSGKGRISQRYSSKLFLTPNVGYQWYSSKLFLTPSGGYVYRTHSMDSFSGTHDLLLPIPRWFCFCSIY